MDSDIPNYRREYLRSPHHAAIALMTLGVGFVAASSLALIVGATLYALAWVHLPDSGFFRKWVDNKRAAAARAVDAQKVADFVAKRDGLVASLNVERRRRYAELSQVCADIEKAGDASTNPDQPTDVRLRKLDELMWTFLRLLGIEESLERFLETERREDLPGILKDAEAEAKSLSAEVDALKQQGDNTAIEGKMRYLTSRLERLEVLRKRQQRIDQAKGNLALVVSEQDRLAQQVKLIRADAIATKNSDALSARIDATVEHLDQTNKWLSEFKDFKDLVQDMPDSEQRVGYSVTTVAPPPIPTAAKAAQAATKTAESVRAAR